MTKPNLSVEVASRIRSELAEGFTPQGDIIERVAESLDVEFGQDEARREAERLFPGLLAEWDQRAATWPAVTDCDRLDAAFEELNAQGIMARHHWTCCSTCGQAAMPGEFDRLGGEWRGTPIIGYAFYHIQDTENAVEGDGLCFNFGSCERADDEPAYEAQSVDVARTVIDALERHGLKVTWDGTYGRRPVVHLTWQRRARPERFVRGDTAA